MDSSSSTTDRTSIKPSRPLGRRRRTSSPHTPPPASPVGTPVRLEVHADADASPVAVLKDTRREQSWRVALSYQDSSRLWTCDLLLPREPTLLEYHFETTRDGIIRDLRQDEGVIKPLYGVWKECPFRIAVYDPDFTPPDWTRGAIVYQIFPDRFHRDDDGDERTRDDRSVYGSKPRELAWSDDPELPPRGRDFFGGTLKGITRKIGYLKELGVSCIYLTPIFESPTNHRYDATDYFRIDPRLGTREDFRALVEAVHSAGMRIVLDGVFNHCSVDHPAFRAACGDRESPYFRWFSFDPWPDHYGRWEGVAAMPQFVECPEVENYFYGRDGVVEHWLAEGIDGWRLDVVPWKSTGFWRGLRRVARKANPDTYLVSEDWADATHRFLGDTFDATMNYRFGYSVIGFANGKLTPSDLDDRLETLRRDTPEPAFHAQFNLIGSHDTARPLTTCGGDTRRLKLAVALQCAYPGVPMIYYGDEAGLDGEYAEAGRKPFPWDSPNAELKEYYRRVLTTRRASPAMSTGEVVTVWADDATSTYAFVRHLGSDHVIAAFNAGSETAELRITLPDVLKRPDREQNYPDLLELQPPGVGKEDTVRITLTAYGAGWFSPEG